MRKQNSLRITKGNNSHRIGPEPLFSILNVYLEDINVFARFDEISSLPVENIKEKPKGRRRTDRKDDRTDGQTEGQRENSIPPQTQFAGDITR